MTTIFRNNTTELYMVDFKMSNPSVFSMPAGDVGMLVGAEIRKETMDDARDPNINGTIPYSTVPEAATKLLSLTYQIFQIVAHHQIPMVIEQLHPCL